MYPKHNNGQVLIEFVTSVIFLSCILALVFSLMVAQWWRARCVFLTFEKTHTTLVGGISEYISFPLEITDTGTSIKGESRCMRDPNVIESVELQKLEP
ncbi:MAG: hypothetical protein AABZ06_07290 [Bdellovibrionota bacterium]